MNYTPVGWTILQCPQCVYYALQGIDLVLRQYWADMLAVTAHNMVHSYAELAYTCNELPGLSVTEEQIWCFEHFRTWYRSI